jgi:acylphosphatase
MDSANSTNGSVAALSTAWSAEHSHSVILRVPNERREWLCRRMHKDDTAHLLFTVAGRVQGVFFRKHTKRAADALGLEGWIVNDPCARKSDSSVSGEAIGDVESIREFSRFLSEQGSPKCVIGSHTLELRAIEDYGSSSGGASGVCGSGGSGGGREEGVGAGVGAGAGAKDTVGAGGTNDGDNEATAVWNRVRSSIRRRGEMRGMARLERGHIPPFFIVK